MTKTNANTDGETAAGDANDPRNDLAYVLSALQPLVAEAAGQDGRFLDQATPCSGFNVADLLDHLVFVAQRVAAIGEGRHFDAVAFEQGAGQWAQRLDDATDAITTAWADPAKLGQSFDVPWGRIPGFGAMLAYTSEFAVHGWDLAQAIGSPFEPAEEHLEGAYHGLTNIPVEGRDNPAMPFDAVVEPPSDATLLEKMAAYTGRAIHR